MTRRYLILLVLGLHTLSGCSVLPQSAQNPEMIRAETLIQNGQNKEAAAIYQQLAEISSSQQNQYRLLAADAFIRNNDIKQATSYLGLINANELNEADFNHLNLLQAQIELSQGNAEIALAQFKAVQTEQLSNQSKIAYYQSLAFAYSLTGDAMQSVQTLLNADALISNTKMRSKLYEQILTTLTGLPQETLQNKQPAGNKLVSGWMALANVLKSGQENLSENLLDWRKTFPAHPANSAFLTDYVKHHKNDFKQTELIAVFLPKSGAYAAAAAVIRDGFMEAYQLAKKNGATQNDVHFYDTEKTSPAELYQRAIKDGAKWVVGPLDKKDIKTLLATAQLTIPVLALNHVEGLSNPKLYQFALSPIDDAGQVAVKAHHDGHQAAMFLVPKSEQGKRFSTYFTESWQKMGGKTVAVQAYNDSKTDFSKFTQQLIAADDADAKVDALILNVYAKPARFLYPQLRKNSSTANVPVYATWQVFLGDADAARDKKLNGVTFCDVPWLFNQSYSGDLSKVALRHSWQRIPPSYLRLLPMGIDAYQLLEHLAALKTQPFNGATGRLKLDSDNRVTRELVCAKFTDGVPKPIGFASENSAPEADVVLKASDAAKVDIEKNKAKAAEIGEAQNSAPAANGSAQ